MNLIYSQYGPHLPEEHFPLLYFVEHACHLF